MVSIIIDNKKLEVNTGTSILESALKNNIYIPHLCAHPDLPPSQDCQPGEKVYQGETAYHNSSTPESVGCQLCLVKIQGIPEPQRACATMVTDGMQVETNTSDLIALRKDNLVKILARHPHACLTCAQNEGCSLTQCSSNVAVNERCCPKFHNCELQKVSEYIGIKPETPRYRPAGKNPIEDEPLIRRDYNLCIACTRCVRACRDLRQIDALGFVVSADKIIVGSRQPRLADSGCKFCGACVEVCPTGALVDKGLKSVEREKDLVPCKYACPAGIDVPEYIRQIKSGNPTLALAVVRDSVPFPSVLGRVCFHPCEEVCRRGTVNEPMAICALKRYAADTTSSKMRETSITHPESRMAIIGAGPAGLTAAYYLARLGYPVTVFESQPEPGGMMRYGIPAYRLPVDVLKLEIDYIISSGVDIKLNQTLGKDFTIQDLKNQGYKAIFISIGAQVAKRISVPGINSDNIWWGMDFLRAVRQGKKIQMPEKVLVIGGGNVAIDVALTGRRLGVKEIQLVCLESPDEMPAHKWEIEQAREENIIINCCWGPSEFVKDTSGKVKAVKFIRCTSVFDNQRCFNPSFDSSVTEVKETDLVILAIGQSPDGDLLKQMGFSPKRGGVIKVDEETLKTEIEGVFAGGEVVHNPGSVVEAVADGQKAALMINKYLGGDGVLLSSLQIPEPTHRFGRDESFAQWRREKMPTRSITERTNNFKQIELGYSPLQAQKEAGRCLQCDLRLKISGMTFPPKKELHQSLTAEAVNGLPEKEGVFQLLDEGKNTIMIKGAVNLKESLQEQIANNKKAVYFMYELDPYYTKRESELIQHYLTQHGKMPEGNDELSDLF